MCRLIEMGDEITVLLNIITINNTHEGLLRYAHVEETRVRIKHGHFILFGSALNRWLLKTEVSNQYVALLFWTPISLQSTNTPRPAKLLLPFKIWDNINCSEGLLVCISSHVQ